MSRLVNAKPTWQASLDFNNRVAVPYFRGDGTVKYMAFTPHGLESFALREAEYDRQFKRHMPRPIGSVALDLLRLSKSAYLPGNGVIDTLLEITIMSSTNGTNDLSTLDGKGLVAHYNGLAKALGRAEVKAFKSKAEALKRIEAITAEVRQPTTEQAEHAAEAEKEKARKAAVLAEQKELDKKAGEQGARAIKAVAESATKATKKTAAKKTSTKAEKAKKFPKAAAKEAKKAKVSSKPRGQGIGAFCMDLILKGKSNDEVLAAVAKKFPDASTSASSVAWYRNKLKSEGKQ